MEKSKIILAVAMIAALVFALFLLGIPRTAVNAKKKSKVKPNVTLLLSRKTVEDQQKIKIYGKINPKKAGVKIYLTKRTGQRKYYQKLATVRTDSSGVYFYYVNPNSKIKAIGVKTRVNHKNLIKKIKFNLNSIPRIISENDSPEPLSTSLVNPEGALPPVDDDLPTMPKVESLHFLPGEAINVQKVKISHDRSFPYFNYHDLNYTEIPPVLIPGGWRGMYITTGWSELCATPDNPIEKEIVFGDGLCGGVHLPTSRNLNDYIPPENVPTDYYNFAKVYNGAFFAGIIESGGQQYIFTVNHDENANVSRWNKDGVQYDYINEMFNLPMDGNPWDSYAGFISSSLTPYDAASGWGINASPSNLGPIIWPAYGYYRHTKNQNGIDETIKVSAGVRHPRGIIYDGYIYVFYLDSSVYTVNEDGNLVSSGKNFGMKLARAPISSSGWSGSFKVLSGGTFSKSAAPEGMAWNTYKNFYSTGTGDSDTLFRNSRTTDCGTPNMFSVAKLKGTDYFIGIEEYAYQDKYTIALRLSTDLINWGKDYVISGISNKTWGESQFHYPSFADIDFRTNSEVSPDGFYILGESEQFDENDYNIQAIKVKIDIN
jgi:hypothetical protein